MEDPFLKGAWGLLNAVGDVDVDAEEQVRSVMCSVCRARSLTSPVFADRC